MIQEDFDHYCKYFVKFFQENQFCYDGKALVYIENLVSFAAYLMKISINECLFLDEHTSDVIQYLQEVQAEAKKYGLPAGPPIPGPRAEPILHIFLDEISKNLDLREALTTA
jgi:hypothetical protein